MFKSAGLPYLIKLLVCCHWTSFNWFGGGSTSSLRDWKDPNLIRKRQYQRPQKQSFQSQRSNGLNPQRSQIWVTFDTFYPVCLCLVWFSLLAFFRLSYLVRPEPRSWKSPADAMYQPCDGVHCQFGEAAWLARWLSILASQHGGRAPETRMAISSVAIRSAFHVSIGASV